MSKLNRSSLKHAQHEVRNFLLKIPYGVTLEEALKPSYYAEMSNTFASIGLTQGANVRLQSDDFAFIADCVVIDMASSFIKLHVMSKYEGEGVEKSTDLPESKYGIKHKGKNMLYCVQDTETKINVQEGFKTKAEAEAFLLDLIKREEA